MLPRTVQAAKSRWSRVLKAGGAGASVLVAAGAMGAGSDRGTTTGTSGVKIGGGASIPRDGSHFTPSSQGVSIVLYCYRSCPFANKVFAFLDHHAVPYAVVEVNPLFKLETSWQSYKRVPFAIINGKQVNDSDGIINAVAELLREQEHAGRSVGRVAATPSGTSALYMCHGVAGVRALSGEAAARETEWRTWCKEDLVHTLSPNIYRTPKEAWQAFEYIGQVSFSSAYGLPAQCVGASIMYLVGKRVASKHGYDPKDLRGALYQRVRKWTDEGLAGRPFCGGEEPDLADLAVFGVLRAIEGLDAFEDMLENTEVGPWYGRMQKAVGESSCHHRLFTKGTRMAPGPHAAPPGTPAAAAQEAEARA